MMAGRERQEVKLMAVVVALYYTQWMLRAKDSARLISLFFLHSKPIIVQRPSALPKLLNCIISRR